MRNHHLLSWLLGLVVLPSIALAQTPVRRRSEPPVGRPVSISAPQSGDAQQSSRALQLPVTRVALYKNGVGYFEHSGHITGSQSVTIDFTTSQLNDVLQSLTAIDLDGGRIAGADYNSTAPLEQQLRALPLALGQDPNSVDFYNAIRGSRVEVRSDKVTATGRLLKLEVVDSNGAQFRLITVVGEDGTIHTVSLTPTTSVRLLDSGLNRDVSRYLELLAGTRNSALRHLTLRDDAPGTGSGAARDLRVSYISEVPVWKSTYRILFTDDKKANTQPVTLQGWSVVDNTTGEDWNNVQLSLIAGAPQSFVQPLSQPIYSRRPEVAIAASAQITPQTHESGDAGLLGGGSSAIQGTVRDPTGATISRASVEVRNLAANTSTTTRTDPQGRYTLPSLPAGQYRVTVSAPGFVTFRRDGVGVGGGQTAVVDAILNVGSVSESVEVRASPMALNTESAMLSSRSLGINYELAAAASIAPNATGAAFDDYFAYNLAEPVTIRKNESALVPILQTRLDAERVTLWSEVHPTPLRALWVNNSSQLTLDRGSFTIIENGGFSGQGLLDPIHPGEKRLLSYAVDQAVRVSAENQQKASRLVEVTATKGVVVLRSKQTQEVTYVVHNAAPDARTVMIEYPVQDGYELDPGMTPAEKTADVYRFRVVAQPGKTERLRVSETFPGEARFELADSDEDQLAVILKETGQNPVITAELQPIVAAKHAEAEADDSVQRIQKRIDALRSDEERQRANVTALASADKTVRDRFVRDLNGTEDKIAEAQKELETAEAAQQAAKTEVQRRIEAIQLEQKF